MGGLLPQLRLPQHHKYILKIFVDILSYNLTNFNTKNGFYI